MRMFPVGIALFVSTLAVPDIGLGQIPRHPELSGLNIVEIRSGLIREERPGGPNVGPVDGRFTASVQNLERDLVLCRASSQMRRWFGATPNYVGYRIVSATEKSVTWQYYVQADHTLLFAERRYIEIAFWATFIPRAATERQRQLLLCSFPTVQPVHNPDPPREPYEPWVPSPSTPIPGLEVRGWIRLQCIDNQDKEVGHYDLFADSNRSCEDAWNAVRSSITSPDFCRSTNGRLDHGYSEWPDWRNGDVRILPSSQCR